MSQHHPVLAHVQPTVAAAVVGATVCAVLAAGLLPGVIRLAPTIAVHRARGSGVKVAPLDRRAARAARETWTPLSTPARSKVGASVATTCPEERLSSRGNRFR